MTRDVACVPPDTKFLDVINTMRENRFSCLIVTENSMPLGIITERDVVRLIVDIAEASSGLTRSISTAMTKDLITLNEEDSLFEALVVAKTEKIRHLPVVDSNGRLSGLVTQTDLVDAHFQVYEQQMEVLEQAISERTEELLKANEELRTLSLEDGLLGIGNRRSMEIDLKRIHATALRYKNYYSLMLIDIDYFKLYNDNYGHPAGDKALIDVVNSIRSSIRESDRVYRYGGEEFLVLLPETPMEGAEISANRLVDKLRELKLPHCKSSFEVVTISIGIATLDLDRHKDKSWQDIVSLADAALYKAKESGRCKAVVIK